LDHFRERLELWYNKNAERLTGKFKSTRVLPLTFVIAIIITVLGNADSLALGKYLYQNKEATKQLADQAMLAVDNYKERVTEIKGIKDTAKLEDSAAIIKLNENLSRLQNDISFVKDSLAVKLPLGWKNGKVNLAETGQHLIGWIASVLAICLGAPFWFDLLNKIANLRSTGARPPTDKT
jgi:hypothetical protein